MGAQESTSGTTLFSDEELAAYEDCTFFNRKEILRIHRRFEELNPVLVLREKNGNVSSDLRVTLSEVMNMPEFKENPFRHRLGVVFAEDMVGGMTFTEFLEMFSIFSLAAPRDIKALYAFKIYDFDGDGAIGMADLRELLRCLTRNQMTDDEVEYITEKIFEEMDMDQDERLTNSEFDRVISHAPDFLSTFRIRM